MKKMREVTKCAISLTAVLKIIGSKIINFAHYYIIAINNVTWMARALLGNGPVNTPRPNTHKETMEDVSQWNNVIARC
jgi:hypothetical protein